jgi:hypothetical protein
MWTNYDINQREHVDGTFGAWTIVEYILECKDTHNTETCTKDSVNGGCFLCDFIKCRDIIGIKSKEVLNFIKKEKIDSNDSESHNSHSESDDSENFVMDITI